MSVTQKIYLIPFLLKSCIWITSLVRLGRTQQLGTKNNEQCFARTGDKLMYLVLSHYDKYYSESKVVRSEMLGLFSLMQGNVKNKD